MSPSGTLKPNLALPPALPPSTPLRPSSAKRLRDAQLRLVGDVANRARQRAGAEQCALRPAQHLDAFRVEQIEVGREERQRDDRFVEVDANLLLHAGLIAHDLTGGDATDGHLTLPGPEVLHRQPGDVRRHALDVLDAASAQHLLGGRRDRERHVEDRLLALGGRDGDLLGQLRLQREVELLRRAGRDFDILCGPAEACQPRRPLSM